jgi:ubiquinone biosynthesis protein
MERLDGISMSDHEALVAEDVDLSKLARQGADIWFEMIFRDRFYHADPHPGNLLVLPKGIAGLFALLRRTPKAGAEAAA